MGGYHLDAFRSFCHHLVGFWLGAEVLEEGVSSGGRGECFGSCCVRWMGEVVFYGDGFRVCGSLF